MNMVTKGLLAATALITLPSMAQAAIVTFNTPISVPNNVNGVYINLLTGATGTSTSAVPGWDFNPYGTTTLSFFWPSSPSASSGGVASTTTGPYLGLTNGSVVSAASTFSTASTTLGSPYRTTGTNILGFRFFNEATSAINYGYLTINTTATLGQPATISGWSFENSGGAITVGATSAVPEPATWAMMIGGFGLAGGMMRRRASKVAFA